MFRVFCPTCEATVLLSVDRITAIENGPFGITVTFQCWEGHFGREDRGHPATARRAAPDQLAG